MTEHSCMPLNDFIFNDSLEEIHDQIYEKIFEPVPAFYCPEGVSTLLRETVERFEIPYTARCLVERLWPGDFVQQSVTMGTLGNRIIIVSVIYLAKHILTQHSTI